MTRHHLAAIAALFFTFTSASLRAEAPREALFELIPPDAMAVFGTTNLRNANDNLAYMLEAMDRGQFLLGGRPLDLIKSTLGFPVGVNDLGGLAIAVMPPVEGNDDHSFGRNYVAIVAVTDADDFLNGNCGRVFKGDDGQATCFHGRLGGVHAQTLGSHVAISPRRDVLDRIRERDRDADFVKSRLGEDGLATARQGDLFMYIHDDACANHLPTFLPQLKQLVQFVPPMPGVESKVFSIDFDPLGAFVRGRSVFAEGTEEAKLSKAISEARGEARGPMLSVPDRPFIVAGGVNASIITSEIAQTWGGKAWAQQLLDALVPAQSADFAMYPVDGYLLNESMLVLRGSDGQKLEESLRKLLEAQERASVSWSDDRFEARVGSPSAMEALLLNPLFGPAGPRGVVGHVEGGAYLAPSRREATLSMARDAAAGRGESLADQQVIQSMQSWMPETRDFEMYIDPAELVPAMAKAAPTGAFGDAALPMLERGAPPVGVAVEVKPGAAHWIIILPSNVLTPMVDVQMGRLQRRATQPNHGNQP